MSHIKRFYTFHMKRFIITDLLETFYTVVLKRLDVELKRFMTCFKSYYKTFHLKHVNVV